MLEWKTKMRRAGDEEVEALLEVAIEDEAALDEETETLL